MKVWKLSKWADDVGALKDPDDAEFINNKLQLNDTLDFTGIVSVTVEFIEALFKNHKPESLSELGFDGRSGAVDEVLEAWLSGKPATSAPKPQRIAKPRVKRPTTPTTPPPTFTRTEPEGERYTPTRLANRLRKQLQSYIESAYPLSDSTLIKARRKLLEDHDGGRLLAQDPFVETTPRYRTYQGTYGDLALPKTVSGLLKKLSKIPTDHDSDRTLIFAEMYQHQAQAFEAALGRNKDLVVATGTGSGKTECFLIPLLGRLYQEAVERPQTFQQRSVRALILYPMNALVNDQLSRLRLLVGSENWLRSSARWARGDGTRCSECTPAGLRTPAHAIATAMLIGWRPSSKSSWRWIPPWPRNSNAWVATQPKTSRHSSPKTK
jgi:hypothetical protein